MRAGGAGVGDGTTRRVKVPGSGFPCFPPFINHVIQNRKWPMMYKIDSVYWPYGSARDGRFYIDQVKSCWMAMSAVQQSWLARV